MDQPQEVINRWVAIKTIRLFRPYIERIFLLKLRLTLKWSERKRKKALTRTFETTIREYRKLQNSEFRASKKIFNIALFFLLAERDLQAIKIDAFTHPDPWKRNLSVRVMLLIIHERDMSKVASGKVMKEIYEEARISDDLKSSMIQAVRGISKAQKRTQKILTEIRNNTIAHRDSDAMLQYELIDKVGIKSAKETIEEYFEASHIFFGILPKLLLEASTLPALLSQYSSSKPNKSSKRDAEKLGAPS
ncbi:hypothetical protein [uncultured Shewanella sp.]|uniref:hypothetical protein n=1 Tax=uncultured Shewanella sp. TaxID=173975 RepID=UPI0026364579|nr:hypothetical protein [uncultured Shewanella sp.]